MVLRVRFNHTLRAAKARRLENHELLYVGKLTECPKELLDQSQINTSFKYVTIWRQIQTPLWKNS